MPYWSDSQHHAGPWYTQGVKWLFIAFAVAVVIGVGIVMIRYKEYEADPGKLACDRAAQIGDASWNARVIDLAKEKKLTLEATTPDARCREMFRKLTDFVPYSRFEKMTKCAAAAPGPRELVDCVRLPY